jgi:hypothetical protein
MSSHDHFLELGALEAIGQLSPHEDAELAEHLRECAECRLAHTDYVAVIHNRLPEADPIRWRIKSLFARSVLDPDARDRFIGRARSEGIDFSAEVELQHARHFQLFSGSWRNPATIACTVTLLALVGIWGITQRESPRERLRTNASSPQLSLENENLRTQLVALEKDIEEKSIQLRHAQKWNETTEASLAQIQVELDKERMRQRQMLAELDHLESENRSLTEQGQQKDAAVADLTVKNEQLHRARVETLSAAVTQEAQVRDLTDSLENQKAKLEREQQLMVLGKDVRQLMGARNLHIIDVHDVEGGGKSDKAFGRVFYAEGQSLIFYAFDLPSNKVSPAKYVFHGWGQHERSAHFVRSLGTFDVDDHDQRRWVLKVTDPSLLAGIDSVFVTAESIKDSKGPSGKKILYAYIIGQANHP